MFASTDRLYAGAEQGGIYGRSELAATVLRQHRRAEARDLLARALPVLRETLLASEVSRAAAEQCATRLDSKI